MRVVAFLQESAHGNLDLFEIGFREGGSGRESERKNCEKGERPTYGELHSRKRRFRKVAEFGFGAR